MPDLGLYNAKYALRRRIQGVLPAFRRVDPNAISWSLLPVGAATAAAIWLAAREGPAWLWLAVVGLVFLRMVLGTLDGLVAVEFGKGTARGELVNRIAPELCDVMYLLAFAFARPEWTPWAIGALALAWLTTFAGLLGAVVGKPTQSVGPVGQTDRLAALQVFAFLAFLGATLAWPYDFLLGFLVWTIVGGTITVALRLSRHLRAVGDAPKEAR